MNGALAARVALGATLLARPATVIRALGGQRDRADMLYARVLGARHLVEAVVLAQHPGRRWTAGGAGVDGIHAASAVWLARRRHHRRLAAINAGTALAFAVNGLARPG